MANYVFHAAASRGYADHGWLRSKHTFSFANYFNPERMNFGALRVLNDDQVAAGMGFGAHPHHNMEIISIPLQGDLEHKDSMGNVEVIRHGDVQVMSAGSGITHSEYNKNKDQEVRFLQIWIIPNATNVEPRYDQLTLDAKDRHNTIQQVISPSPDDEGLWLHQEAWFSLAHFDVGQEQVYSFKGKGTGLYVFTLSGTIEVDGRILADRDGLGITDAQQISIRATADAEFLLMEVPLI
ncbi:pirin family protein [Sphingobacterium griseoflavum]|uniref:Pirin n=1 Tax=Sphingobacterium griseoflavum TaxID=1474952 RepID=A0ABQ3HYV4_9SPHI|nr:pirin family protein [Sphingobacterium griseoflavum]GHE33766.1 hypothetical protein GCM10017764_16250 [Sphingobacterium griseoflavum]